MTNEKRAKKTYGLLGRNISYSISPAMHNAAFRHFNIPAEYVIFDKQENELETFLDDALRGSVSGFNVTVPYKIAVIESGKVLFADGSYGIAAKITGAINTVGAIDGKLLGYNTDCYGFYNSLDDSERKQLPGQEILIVGAGGAGRAIAIFLAYLIRVNVNVYDVDEGKTSSLKDEFDNLDGRKESLDKIRPIRGKDELIKKLPQCKMVINATPLGTKEGDPTPIPLEYLTNGQIVYDLVYARKTELLKYAEEKGLKTYDGLGMLVGQAALSFAIWDGKSILDVDKISEIKKVMTDAASVELKKRRTAKV